jgi:glycosyltransferase involved in cell wall biosynthesis
MVMLFAMRCGLRASPFGDERWDGVITYSPSIFFSPLVQFLKRASGCRAYLIQRDMFPDWAVDLGLMRRGLAYRFLKGVERRQYEAANVIGVQSPSNLSYVTDVVGREGRRAEVLWNWLAPAADIGCSIQLSQTALRGRRVFVYAGNMGRAQSMDAFIDLAESLYSRSDIGFLFVGRGDDALRLRADAERRQLDNALFFDEIDPDEIPGLLGQCHVGLIALDPRHRSHNIPGKFLAYMQAGLPVLARINANNDLVRMIHDSDVGIVNPVDTSDGWRDAAERLIDGADANDRAPRCRRLAETLFSPKAAVSQVVTALRLD